VSLSPNRRTASGKADTVRRCWRVAALLTILAVPGTAHGQALKTVQLSGGETRIGGKVLRVTGGYVDPRTGEARVEHRGGRVVRLTARAVRRVRTSGLVTRIVARSGARLRLRLAQLLFAGGATTLRLDPQTFGDAKEQIFRITGGRLDVRTLAGSVGSTGVLDLGPVQLRDLGVRPAEAVTAQVGDLRGDVGVLDGGARARVAGLTATIGPLDATLTPRAAAGLNFYFQTERFRGGMPLGTVTVRGRLRG
jgi:hypothetical protein